MKICGGLEVYGVASLIFHFDSKFRCTSVIVTKRIIRESYMSVFEHPVLNFAVVL
jgi:hypothetical protein